MLLQADKKNTETLIQKVVSEKRTKKSQVCTEHKFMQDSKDNNNTIPECLKIFMV